MYGQEVVFAEKQELCKAIVLDNYTIVNTIYCVDADAQNGIINITLPLLVNANELAVYTIEKTDLSSNSVIISGSNNEKIELENTYIITNKGNRVRLVKSINKWVIIP